MVTPEFDDQPIDRLSELDGPESVSSADIDESSTLYSFTVCVCSNDAIWADLLAQNLQARGLDTVRCDLRHLKFQLTTLRDDSWVVVDGGWPMIELQNSIDDLNPRLREAPVRTVMVVDELVGQHPLDAFESDTVIKRMPDMRIFVRNLLSIFHASTPDGALRA